MRSKRFTGGENILSASLISVNEPEKVYVVRWVSPFDRHDTVVTRLVARKEFAGSFSGDV